jgi:hypothetical protein
MMSQKEQARALIMTSLRIIRDMQLAYRIPTSSVLLAASRIYRNIGYYDSAQWTNYAARQIRGEELRGGR